MHPELVAFEAEVARLTAPVTPFADLLARHDGAALSSVAPGCSTIICASTLPHSSSRSTSGLAMRHCRASPPARYSSVR